MIRLPPSPTLFFFKAPATTEIYTLPLHAALPISLEAILEPLEQNLLYAHSGEEALRQLLQHDVAIILLDVQMPVLDGFETATLDRKSTRLNSSHSQISYAVFCLKKKKIQLYRLQL